MTEDQVVAKIMKISSDLGLRGHQQTKCIISEMLFRGYITQQDKLYKKFIGYWKFGKKTHVELITEIERILTEKGVLS